MCKKSKLVDVSNIKKNPIKANMQSKMSAVETSKQKTKNKK